MIKINTKKLTDGIILIGIGLLFLLKNLGIIHWSIFSVLFQLWPLILVVAGINIIFKNNAIITIITWGLFFMGIFFYGSLFHRGYIDINSITNKILPIIKSKKTLNL